MQFDGNSAYNFAAWQVAIGPRIPGTDAHRKTGKWIIEQLSDSGWVTQEQCFEHQGIPLCNYVGKSLADDGTSPIIIGAHYDTRPFADGDSFDPTQPVPGANDGASGVAVLLELARILPLRDLEPPVWLVFFDAEDSGRIEGWGWSVGSYYFVDHMQVEPEVAIIVDMVGDAQLELYLEKNSDETTATQIWSIASALGYSSFIMEPRHALIDDHIPFIKEGFLAVDIIDFDYPYHHTTQDTLDKISPDSLEQVGRTLQTWLSSNLYSLR